MIQVRQGEFFEIIGKIVYAGIDCKGNIHIVLKKHDSFWSEVAVRFLRGEEDHIVKMRVMPWNHKRICGRLKSPHKSTYSVNRREADKEE
jgi:hypothetical protein